MKRLSFPSGSGTIIADEENGEFVPRRVELEIEGNKYQITLEEFDKICKRVEEHKKLFPSRIKP